MRLSTLPPAMAAQTTSIFAPAGMLQPPPGFRVEAGPEGEEEYEPSVRDVPASSGLHGALLPTAPEGRVVPAAVSMPPPFVPGATVGVALAAYGLSAPLRHAMLRAFEYGEEDSADALAETSEAEVEEILWEILLDDDSRPPTRMEKGYVRGFFRKLRSHLCSMLALPSSHAPPQPIAVQMPDTTNRLEYRDVLDQASKGCYTLLSPKELSQLQQRYEFHTGAPVDGGRQAF